MDTLFRLSTSLSLYVIIQIPCHIWPFLWISFGYLGEDWISLDYIGVDDPLLNKTGVDPHYHSLVVFGGVQSGCGSVLWALFPNSFMIKSTYEISGSYCCTVPTTKEQCRGHIFSTLLFVCYTIWLLWSEYWILQLITMMPAIALLALGWYLLGQHIGLGDAFYY